MRYLAALTTSLIFLHATAQAAEKSSAITAYNARLAKTSHQALNTEFLKYPERLNGISLNIRYTVDRNGRAHEVKVISRTPNPWAEKTAVRVLTATKFPPIPIEVQLEGGAGYVDAEAELTYDVKAPPTTASLSRNNSPTATVSVHQQKRESRCELAIVAVDGRQLKSPQREVSFPPGRHVLTVKVSFVLGNSKGESKSTSADAPLAMEFEAHPYTIEGKLSPTGGLVLGVDDGSEKQHRR